MLSQYKNTLTEVLKTKEESIYFLINNVYFRRISFALVPLRSYESGTV